MRILHLSDFHLDKKQLLSSKRIVEQLADRLDVVNAEKKIDIILFTGDMIKQGGKSFSCIRDAFDQFDDMFINTICDRIGLDKRYFIFTIGNHDLDKTKEKKSKVCREIIEKKKMWRREEG